MSRAACISREHLSPTIYSHTILGSEREGWPGQGERESRLEAKKGAVFCRWENKPPSDLNGSGSWFQSADLLHLSL